MYSINIQFEWDGKKSSSNKTKHGIAFDTAKDLWNDSNRVEIETSYPIEERTILIGKVKNKLWTAIFTQREDTIRIISVRRARKRETKLYDQKNG